MSAGAADHAPVRPEPPKTYYEGVVKLPGFGTPPDRCRDFTPVGFCDHGHPVLGRSSCGTRYCPDHWRDWLEDAVVSLVARLAAFREARDTPLSHVVASPPQSRRYSVRALWETRSEAYDALEDAGVPGGVAVTHPYRTNERGDLLFRAAVEDGDVEDGIGKWDFLRDLADDHDDLMRYVEPSPHYHVLAPTNYVDGEAAPDGWVAKNVRDLGQFHRWDTESYREMVKPAYYLLTHAGVQDGRQSVTYFGAVHPANFDPAEELTAAVWTRIQEEAERAVKTKPSEERAAGGGEEPEECPHEDCEAPVLDLEELGDRLDDDEWVSDLLAERDGRDRWLQLRGAWLWSRGMTDRPPPSVATSEERMLNWLKVQGEKPAGEPRQQSLPSEMLY